MQIIYHGAKKALSRILKLEHLKCKNPDLIFRKDNNVKRERFNSDIIGKPTTLKNNFDQNFNQNRKKSLFVENTPYSQPVQISIDITNIKYPLASNTHSKI